MSTKNYRYNDTFMLAEHFSVSEFRCKCGGTHDTILNPELPEKLELLFKALNCSAIVITSGYRCPTHSVNIGGSATDFHTKGYASDIVCYDQSGNKISSKKVSCVAQDVGFGGIANIDGTYTATHVDVRTSNFWKGDEVVTSDYSVTNDFYKYYGMAKSSADNSAITARGIDVSEHQGVIDWDKVKASEKVDFAIIRAGYGKEISQIDKQFERNYSECKRLNIPVGAYWYTYATTEVEAKQEASVCLKTLAGKSFEYPVAYDIEETASLSHASEVCGAFCSELEKNGWYTAVYSFKNAFENNIGADITTWFDTFLSHVDVAKSDYSGDYGLWQYSWTGRIEGISSDVDLDYAYQDYPTIIKNAGLNGFKKSDTQVSVSEKNTLEQILDHVASIDGKIK
ncbi:MAG: D-Ala-D-Ala carboxypeptidase family metallohydrolase [Ruminococcus flavefaciens]|nr:D-Ala-D-Ala carboxypeptidase family metallohydrolase [Ruminococcus flavefaciens]